MKTMPGKLIIVMMIVFVGCKDEGRLDLAYDVDPHLVGDWYNRDTLAPAQPSPRIAVRGMRITAEKTIRPLGLEFPTGRLALMESNELKYILHAKDGLLVVQYFAPPDITIDSLRYTFQNNTLVLTDRYSSQTYRPITVGSQLTEPIQAVMNVTIDSTRVRSLRVAPVVPVYLSKLHPSHLQFHAVIPDGRVRIDLQGFTGVGSYALGPGDGLLMLIDGDVVFTFTTDSLATGIMSIDEYDEATSRCAGRFAFTVRTPGPHGPPITRQLSEGSFSAPVYR